MFLVLILSIYLMTLSHHGNNILNCMMKRLVSSLVAVTIHIGSVKPLFVELTTRNFIMLVIQTSKNS